jgi:AcrR family transcriptional regulator
MAREARKTRCRRPVQSRSQDTVEVILRATAHILARQGTQGLTTNRVAAKAGVSIGSLYQYFPDKDALVAEIRRRYEEAFRDRLIALARDLDGLRLRDAIARCVRELIALHAEDPRLHNAVSAAGIAAGDRRLLHQLAASWLDARRREVRRPDRPLAAAIALDAAESLIHGVALREPERLAGDAFATEVTDLLVRYLVR